MSTEDSPPSASSDALHSPPDSQTVLLYDGTCGFCSWIVQFVLRHERERQSLRFATLQGPRATTLRERVPRLAEVDSVIWHEPASAGRGERVLVQSDAGLAVMSYIGGAWRVLAAMGRCVPRPIRDAVYNMVARNRHKLMRGDTCFVPTPAQRARFID